MLAEAFLVAHIVRIGMLPLRTRAVILFYVFFIKDFAFYSMCHLPQTFNSALIHICFQTELLTSFL